MIHIPTITAMSPLQEYFLGSGPASSGYEPGAAGGGPGGLPALAGGLNGGYYGALPGGLPVQPAHSSAPVNLLGPTGPISSLVGAPGTS